MPGPSFSENCGYKNLFIQISYINVYVTVQKFDFLKENLSKFIISNFKCFAVIFHEVITVSIFLAQQITTKTDLRCFEKLGPGASFTKILYKCFSTTNF